jgi:hypothetical protein
MTHPSQHAGRKSTHTGSFLFHWPEELSTLGSSISPSGNLHPQITSRNFPFILREIGLCDFANPVIKCLIPQTLKPDLTNSNIRSPKEINGCDSPLDATVSTFSCIESSRLLIPKSLVDANPKFPNPYVNFGYSYFASCNVI